MARRISVIIPSFNDARILRAIRSVRHFDDAEAVSIIVIDGGSRLDLREAIDRALGPEDIFIQEPDQGIFDALNKGLGLCQTDFLGWLGSDDFYSGQVRASEVVSCLEDHDLLVTNLAHFRGDRVTRLTHSLPSRARLARIGLNAPHFGTFGRRSFLASRRFDINDRSADIDYFISLFETRPRISTIGKVGVLAEEGGFSTASRRKILALNVELLGVYRNHVGRMLAPLCVALKLSYKAWSAAYYRVFRRSVQSCCAPNLSL